MSKGRLLSELQFTTKTGQVITGVTLVIVAVSLLVITGSLLFGLSSQPAFCGLCHSREFKTWRQSTHQRAACNSCHRVPGALGIATQRFEVLRMSARYPLGLYRKPISAFVDNKSCLLCHENVIGKGVVKRRGIKMSHLEPEKAGYSCSDCHGGVVHQKKIAGLGRLSMELCLKCHVGDQTENCETCHAGDIPREGKAVATVWRLTHGKNWRKLHGMGNVMNCESCHRSGEYCRRCHATEIPHSAGWLNLHGKEAKPIVETCTVCHDRQSFCENCHGLRMPHPDDFLPRHSSEVKKFGQEQCGRCHRPDGCDECHIRHIHPGLSPDLLDELRRKVRRGQ